MNRSSNAKSGLLVLLVALAALAGCEVETFDDVVGELDTPATPAADDTANDTSTDPDPATPPAGPNPVFSDIQTSIFTPSCASASCHGGGSPAADLDLEADASYSNLVGVASTQDAGIQRVVAGDPNASYLVQKLEGSAATGNVMPPSGGLPQATIDVVRQWITDGAIDDRVATTTPVKLRALSPSAGTVLKTAPSRVIAGFDRELNAASVDGHTIIIESTGGDGDFENGAVAVAGSRIQMLANNPTGVLIDLSEALLPNDTYRVRISGGQDLAVEDLDGQRFDGDADGTAGGDFEAVFTLKRD